MEQAEAESRPRRRGRALEDAIHDAVIAELAEVGYGAMTLEGVASRAQTSRSVIYRRWGSLQELVVETIDRRVPMPEQSPDTGSVRTDLITVLGRMAGMLGSPTGSAYMGLIGEARRSPALHETVFQRILKPRWRGIEEVIARGVERGELRPGAASPFAALSGPALVFLSCSIHGLTLSSRDIADIVDQVVLPALGPP